MRPGETQAELSSTILYYVFSYKGTIMKYKFILFLPGYLKAQQGTPNPA